MKRKVVKHGPSTLIVSLPSKWAKKYNIKPGDEVDVSDEDNTLRISKGTFQPPVKKISVDTRGIHELSAKFLVGSLHKSGFDEIEFFYDNPKVIQHAKQCIDSTLIGYVIVDQTHNRCIIKNLGGDADVDFDQLLRRIFLVTLSLAKSSHETIELGELNKLKEVLVLEQTNNKLTMLCQRLISKKRFDENKAQFMYLIIWLLESVADHYRDLVKTVLSAKHKMQAPMLRAYAEVNRLFESYYKIYYKYSLQKLLELRDQQRKVMKDLGKLVKKTKKETDIAVLIQLINVTQRVDDFLATTSILHL